MAVTLALVVGLVSQRLLSAEPVPAASHPHGAGTWELGPSRVWDRRRHLRGRRGRQEPGPDRGRRSQRRRATVEATGERDPSGPPTGGTSPTGGTAVRPGPGRVTGPSTSATRRATASHRSPVRGGPSRGRPTPPGSLRGSTSTGLRNSRSTGSTGCARRCSPCRPDWAPPGDVDPVWSPDGASLLVPNGVEIPVDGSTPRLLPADDPRSQWMATYSPDGAEIAYISRDGLAVAAADGSQARVLVPGALEDFPYAPFGLEWSPTGDRIAFVQASGESTDVGPATELGVLDVASGTVVSLAEHGRGLHTQSIKFSPEGDQILFTRADAAVRRHSGAFTPTAPTSTDWWPAPAGAIGKR